MNNKFIATLLLFGLSMPYALAYDEIKLDKVQEFDIQYKDEI